MDFSAPAVVDFAYGRGSTKSEHLFILCGQRTIVELQHRLWEFLHCASFPGVEFIYLSVAAMGLCFGCVLATVFLTQRCFPSC